MAENRQLLSDIRLALRHAELRPVYTVDADSRRVLIQKDLRILEDIGTISGTQNLAQAIILRLLTPRGELAALGHPDYGSRLHELIGQQNTETNRNLAKLFILEALQMETRIEKIIEVTVAPDQYNRDRVNIQLQVQPGGQTGSVVIGPFTLELGL